MASLRRSIASSLLSRTIRRSCRVRTALPETQPLGIFEPSMIASQALVQGSLRVRKGLQVTPLKSSAGAAASAEEPVVFVVDDDAPTRQALARLFYSVQLRVEVFASAKEFLQSKRPDVPSCLVLDVRLPGLSGLDFQTELVNADIKIPIVFITGHGDVPMTVRAMKAGAVDFLLKPFRDQDLLDAVTSAIQRDQTRRNEEKRIADMKTRLGSLTPREREIMGLVASGLLSKQIAAQINVSEITVKVHRSHLMKKMGARSVADLVRMAEALGITTGTPRR